MNLIALLLLASAVAVQGEATLIDQLKPLAPFVGKTWRGTFKDSTPQMPRHDVARWERALNGRAVRVLHSINDGEYGGETLIVWDANKKSLVFYYFTTAGFYTTGTVKVEGSKLVTHEYVAGNANGVTEVRATTEIAPDRKMISRSEYLQNGKWGPGHEITYVEAPGAEVRFR
jgi:hypothetical protein